MRKSKSFSLICKSAGSGGSHHQFVKMTANLRIDDDNDDDDDDDDKRW